MKIKLQRYSENKESTSGLLFIDDIFQCYTIEDIHQDIKVFGKTRIPAGIYNVEFRTTGGFHNRYGTQFFKIHLGMLEIKNVPGFKYVLIHIGNEAEDSAGCILLGDTANNNQVHKGFIGESRKAYTRVYLRIAEALQRKEKVTIEVIDPPISK